MYSADESGELTRKTTFEYYSENSASVIEEIQTAISNKALETLLENRKDNAGFKNALVGLGVKPDSYYALSDT